MSGLLCNIPSGNKTPAGIITSLTIRLQEDSKRLTRKASVQRATDMNVHPGESLLSGNLPERLRYRHFEVDLSKLKSPESASSGVLAEATQRTRSHFREQVTRLESQPARSRFEANQPVQRDLLPL